MGCLGFNRVIYQFKNRFNILTSEQDRQNEDRWEQIHHSYELSIEVANCSFITIPSLRPLVIAWTGIVMNEQFATSIDNS